MTEEWVKKQNQKNVIYTYNRIIFSLVKEDPDTSYNMNEPWGHHAKWNKPVTKGQMLYDSTYMRFLEYQTHRDRKENGGCQGWGGRGVELVFKGHSFSVGRWEHSGDGWRWYRSATLSMHSMPLSCTLKELKWSILWYVYFSTIKKYPGKWL